jgi:hypothetical protein
MIKTSITEALKTLRPDLTKAKRFRSLSTAQRVALVGDYTEYNPEPAAKQGELNSDEKDIGNEINRIMADEAQRRLIEQEQFLKRHAASLAGLCVLALFTICFALISGRGDVRASTAVVHPQAAHPVPAVVQTAAAPTAKAAPVVAPKPAALVATAAAPARDDDEIPVLQSGSTRQASAPQTAALNPVTRSEKVVSEPAKMVAALTPAVMAPAPAPAAVATPNLEDGAAIANQSSIAAADQAGLVPVADAGEVLYEAAPAPTASANASAAPRKSTRRAKGSGSEVSADDSSDAPGGLRVEGIFWDKTRPLALIGDKIVEVGSNVGGAKVVAINPDGVIIDEAGKNRTLRP